MSTTHKRPMEYLDADPSALGAIGHEPDAVEVLPAGSVLSIDEASLAELEREPEVWLARSGRRTARAKLLAGLRGLKHAVRGDSSFFAHAYRTLLIALAAGLLGVSAGAWCLLAIVTAMVLIAEIANSAIDTLARAIGDPEEPRLKAAREIGSAGVLVAVTVKAAVAITVITLQLGRSLSWW